MYVNLFISRSLRLRLSLSLSRSPVRSLSFALTRCALASYHTNIHVFSFQHTPPHGAFFHNPSPLPFEARLRQRCADAGNQTGDQLRAVSVRCCFPSSQSALLYVSVCRFELNCCWCAHKRLLLPGGARELELCERVKSIIRISSSSSSSRSRSRKRRCCRVAALSLCCSSWVMYV